MIPAGISRQLQFYLSGPQPCPYFSNRVERKLFTRLTGEKDTDGEINNVLSRAGFRRSHNIVYRPACVACRDCVPVRVPTADFRLSRSQKRVMRRNAAFVLGFVPAVATEEHFALFGAYQKARHPDSEMADMSFKEFTDMIEDSNGDALLCEWRDADGLLQGAMLIDRLYDGASAIYSYYRLEQARRSLGTYLILSLIEKAREAGYTYVYLGYWTRGALKMDYKKKFQPAQVLTDNGWISY